MVLYDKGIMRQSHTRQFVLAVLLAAVAFFLLARGESPASDSNIGIVPEIGVRLVHAGPDLTGALSGAAWSSTIGWVSFNSANSWTGSSVPYVVRSDADGYLSGHAWNPNIGWLSFNRADTGTPPQADISTGGVGAIARLSGNRLIGWARFLSACTKNAQGRCTGTNPEAGGWDGWVSLSDFSGAASYGVGFDGTILGGGAYATSVAWGSTNVGWLSFSKAAVGYDAVSLVPANQAPPEGLAAPTGLVLAPPRLSFLTDRPETSTFGTLHVDMNPPVTMTLSYGGVQAPAGVTVTQTITPIFSQNPVTASSNVRIRFRVCAALPAGCNAAKGHALPKSGQYLVTINGTYNDGTGPVTVPFVVPVQVNSLVNKVKEK